jgi:hypothetical protein
VCCIPWIRISAIVTGSVEFWSIYARKVSTAGEMGGRGYQLRQPLLRFLVLQPHALLHGFFALRDHGGVDGGFEALKDLQATA